ncbi:MAG: hypothetical protein AAF367_15015 [Pseudomonadota bacterium]
MKVIAMAACAALLVAACAPIKSTSTTKNISRDFVISSGTTRDGNTDLSVAVHAFPSGGKVMICAAAGAEGNTTFTPEWPAALLRVTSLYIGGDRLVSGLDFGTHYYDTAALRGKQSNCAILDQPWRSEYDDLRQGIRIGKVRLLS